MGRKYLGKVTQNFRISPEFQEFCRREAEAAGKTLGDWLEDYFMQTNPSLADSQNQIVPKPASEKTIETACGESERDADEAIRRTVLALQAWLLTPTDTVSRDAFESALKRCFIERG